MSKRTSKKIIHEADASGNMKFSSTLDMQGHDADQMPESAVQAKETAADQVAEQAEGDTDIGKKINDVIEREYPRTRIGTDGYLQAILCELIRARLSK